MFLHLFFYISIKPLALHLVYVGVDKTISYASQDKIIGTKCVSLFVFCVAISIS